MSASKFPRARIWSARALAAASAACLSAFDIGSAGDACPLDRGQLLKSSGRLPMTMPIRAVLSMVNRSERLGQEKYSRENGGGHYLLQHLAPRNFMACMQYFSLQR